MRFSDIHMIMIGEEGEYGRRLVRYLETHLSTAIRYIILQQQKVF